MSGRRVCIVVLGDIGHSPRMQYHSLSLASHDFDVDFVGYGGSLAHQTVLNNNKISFHVMKDVPVFSNYFPRLISYVLKVLWQTAILFTLLLSLNKPDFILLQNPPSIPTLPVVWIVSRIRKCNFVIDWHNYGYTILALTLGQNHVLVKLCKWCENYFGRKADYHLCVTKALKNDLFINLSVSASVLYDRPPAIFHDISIEEKHQFFVKIQDQYQEIFNNVNDNNETIFTTVDSDNKINYKKVRSCLIVSSTSWTEDEDFNILINALELYESYADNQNYKSPKLFCVITGKGPLKSYYMEKISNKAFKNVKFLFPWLTAEDYPKLLACADIGISLHKSSSNLDLPMKIADMFGCCLPVCALEYQCINELVKHEENGLLFTSSDELFAQLKRLLEMFPELRDLNYFRNNLKNGFSKLRWDQCWDENALPIFRSNDSNK